MDELAAAHAKARGAAARRRGLRLLDTALIEDPVLAALIDYLAQKGVINTVEFAAEVNKRCQALVSSQESVFREKG